MRTAVLGVFVLVALYVTLPYWVPTGLVKGYLAGTMSEQMGVTVSIEEMSLSWSRGAELRELIVRSPESFGGGPMIVVRKIRVELSPLDLLLRDRIEWMELEEPHALIQFDRSGNLNLSVLEKLKFGPNPVRIGVREAGATVRLPDHERLLKVNVKNAEYVAGRLQRLGRVTVSAALDQQGSTAPVSLRLAGGGTEQTSLGDALFNFSNIDLGQIPLGKLLGLQLRKLGGRARGSLDLRINRQGVVDQFSLNVMIRDLEVHPEQGPELPLIPEAGVRISAIYDPVTETLTAGLVDIRSASIRLPGVDLAGRASISTDFLQGRWEAVNTLHLKGNLYPRRLVALLTGQGQLPGDLEIAGPLSAELSVTRDGAVFSARAELDATETEFHQPDDLLKPRGVPLKLKLIADLDRRDWRLQVNQEGTELHLGDNTFCGGGTISDIRPFGRCLLSGGSFPTQGIFECLEVLDWEGSCRIGELESLNQLLPPLRGILGPVRLKGQMTGNLSVRQFPDTRFQGALRVPDEAELSFGRFFVKDRGTSGSPHEPGKGLGLEVSGKVDAQEQSINMLDVDLVVGDGRASISNGTLKMPSRPDGSIGLFVEGRFDAENTESLFACFPSGSACPGTKISGGAHGGFRMSLEPDRSTAQLEADLKNTDFEWVDVFHKARDQETELAVTFVRDLSTDSPGHYRVDVKTSFPHADINGSATFGNLPPQSGGIRFSGTAEIGDARWVTDTFPLIKRLLADGQLSGPGQIKATGVWEGDKLDIQLECNADDVSFATRGEQPRTKSADTALRVWCSGSLETRGKHRTADIRSARLQFGKSKFDLSSKLDVDSPLGSSDLSDLLDRVKGVQGEINAQIHLEAPLARLLPEISEPVKECELEGKILTSAKVVSDAHKFSIVGELDAGELSVGRIGPLPLVVPNEENPERVIELGRLSKPLGTKSVGEIEITIPKDLSRLQINNLSLDLADVNVLADAVVEMARPSQGWSLPERSGNANAHLSVWIPRAETLEQFAPFLRSRELSGDAFVELQFDDQGEGQWVVTAGEFRTNGLSGDYRGRPLALSGAASFRDVRLVDCARPLIGSFRTEGLEFQIGENHCWLIADLAELPERPNGTFHLLAKYVDDKDILDWVSSLNTHRGAATQTANASTIPTTRSYRLDGEETESLLRETDKLLVSLREYLVPAELQGRVSIERLRTFDPSVDRSYDVGQVEVRISLTGGEASMNYVAALNGGTLRNSYDVQLTDPVPLVAYEANVRDVIATENIQPQLAKYFPGNTVSGLFNRTERSTVPLRNLLANLIDHRYPLCQTGTAKTITTDGLLEGRAAPRFVTRIFPGLNMAKYSYNKMTSFATFRPDGTAQNDMVFSGRTYDMYIEGTTDVENIGRYHIGLILLGTPQSAEWNHRYRQGRIPILKLKARIEGGRMHDESVSYFWPNESLFVIFLRNNIFYRIWLAARNRPGA